VDPRIQIVLKVIAEREVRFAPTPEEAAALLGLSSSRLRRIFHREVGTTYSSHLRQMRIARAGELLQNYTRSIKAIAHDCGYVDVSNFYRDFRKQYGTTPRDARMKSPVITFHVEQQSDITQITSSK
jgi:AraC-like DNA-binding protein